MNHFSKLSPVDIDDDSALTSLIADAISKSRFTWRTSGSLAKELEKNEKVIECALNSSDRFLRAKLPNSRGEFLYTTKELYKKNIPFSHRLFGAAANTVTQ